MRKKIQDFIAENKLFEPSDTLVLAISGGVDSVVLAHLLKDLGYALHFAHCNFQLRGVESDDDARMVNNLAFFLNVPCHIKTFDTKSYAEARKCTIQEAARHLRYEWFETLRQAIGAAKIVVAHHAEDSIETVLYNFTKGTGLRGLRGIQPLNGFIARPLLWAFKEDIVRYAMDNRILFREDSSNFREDYTRNFIRLQIIPKLRKINPQFDNTALNNLKNLNNAYQLLDFFIEKIRQEACVFKEESIEIDCLKLQAYPSVEAVLFELLKPYNPHPRQVGQVYQAAFIQNKTGATFYLPEHRLLVDRHFIKIRPLQTDEPIDIHIAENTREVILPTGLLSFDLLTEPPFTLRKDPSVAQVDFDLLTFPLTLRRWHISDRFQPFGMKGKSQLLSDYFRSRKFSDFDKQKTWILTNANSDIIWLVGHRLDERFKLTKNTLRCLAIKIN